MTRFLGAHIVLPLGDRNIFMASGNGFCVYSVSTGERGTFVVTPDSFHSKKDLPAGSITCAFFNERAKVLALSTLEKELQLWCTKTWKRQYMRTTRRRVTHVVVLDDGSTILAGDKSGQVLRYSSKLSNTSEACLLLGQPSVLTDFCVSTDNLYLIVSTRDEKVCVYRYPETYEIQTYCMGHRSPISSIHPLSGHNRSMLSISKDYTLVLWDIVNGRMLDSIHLDEVNISSFGSSPKIIGSHLGDKIAVFSKKGCKLVVFRIASDGQSIISDSIIIEVDYPILDAAFSSDDLVLVSYYPQDEKPPLVGSISISSCTSHTISTLLSLPTKAITADETPFYDTDFFTIVEKKTNLYC